MRRIPYANKAFWLAAMIVLTVATIARTNAFVPLAPARQSHHHQRFVQRRDCRLLALKRLPDESEKAFFQRVTAAAADPVAFERLVAEDAKQPEPEKARANSTEVLDGIGTSTDKPKRRSGYVRAEEWEAEEQRKRKSGELSWEERVAFDGQRHGDRFAQNEILRRNLKLW